ncbi:PTR2-domain-containing protein, partial [Amniculicola lignicola CBS 123094]
MLTPHKSRMDPDTTHTRAARSSPFPLKVPLYEATVNFTETLVRPTDEELKTLRRVPDKIPWRLYTIGFLELVERMSYYGTAQVFVNFIESARTEDNKPSGAPKNPHDPQAQPGALGMGQRTSTALTTFNQFWIYVMPLLGAYVADTYLGRFRAVCHAIIVAVIGHIILTISAVPVMLTKPQAALGIWIIGIIIMGVGTGFFKPSISPLIAEQMSHETMYIMTTKKGERVIVDPAVTSTRAYNCFYFFINIGSLVGEVSMPYMERYVGYWAAYLIPTMMLLMALPVLIICQKFYKKRRPEGSVLYPAVRLLLRGMEGRIHLNPIATHRHLYDGTFWQNVKPSHLGAAKPQWMTFDDAWVDEVARGWSACGVFLWYPLYFITYNQMSNNLTSQAKQMSLHGLPNNILNALNALSIMIMVPLMDYAVYPALRKAKVRFTPIKRITSGFFVGALAMIWTCVVQAYIYKTSKCGSNAELWSHAKKNGCTSPLNVWLQAGSFVLIGLSEIFTIITAYEYAFTKAPQNMRSYLQAFIFLMVAVSAAIGEALVPLSENPLLVWNYGTVGVIAFVAGCLFYLQHRQLDGDEDRLNMLPTGQL